MERAFIFSGYEVEHAWGEGGHDGKQATEVFPEAQRFLWQDWPQPVKAGAGSPQLKDILLPGEGWQLVGEGYGNSEGPAVNTKGEVFFNDVPNGKTWASSMPTASRRSGSPTASRATASASGPMAGSTPPPAPPSRSSHTTPTARPRSSPT